MPMKTNWLDIWVDWNTFSTYRFYCNDGIDGDKSEEKKYEMSECWNERKTIDERKVKEEKIARDKLPDEFGVD